MLRSTAYSTKNADRSRSMGQIQQRIEPLAAGDKLTWEEFERAWEAMPELKRAELIGGTIYMPSPLAIPHSSNEIRVSVWLSLYGDATPGCQALAQATTRMFTDAPQPDCQLRILEECGGKSGVEGDYVRGAVELVAEICHSSAAYDLHQKKDLYRKVGVEEYVAVLVREKKVLWHRWQKGGYGFLSPDKYGIFHSVVFPGLWLNPKSLFADDLSELKRVLELGIKTPEHAAFVEKLAKRKKAHNLTQRRRNS